MAGRKAVRGIGVEVKGAAQVRRALRKAGADTTDLRGVHREVARDVVAVTRPPRRSGDLAGSLAGTGTTTKAIISAGNRGVPYAGPIHFGWHTRPNPSKGWRGGPVSPQPFIYEALDQRRDAVLDAYEDRMRELCRRVEAES